MKFHAMELPSSGKQTPQKLLLATLTLLLLTTIPLHILQNSNSPLPSPKININGSTSIELEKKCDIFRGKWVPYLKVPYYTNATCSLIIDQQNCMKFGSPDTEFLKWRWQPDECELPLFDAVQFLELVRGKSIAFVGDSVGRNQMQSLLCLLATVVYPENISNKYNSDTINFQRWFYADYNFTLAFFWAPFLVKARDADPNGPPGSSLMSLYLDEAEETWATQIQTFDYAIISAGQWFFRPQIFYENGRLVGCHNCHTTNITDLTIYYGYRKAFRTAFSTLQRLKNYKGVTFLRTFSPSHFENGEWDKGGNCGRKRPFTEEEMKLDGYVLELYLTQVEEFRAAEEKGRKRGLKFGLVDASAAMVMRGDGHPNYYGQSGHGNRTTADCVHWCLPGPIDTWNEFLSYMLKVEGGS